MSRQLRLDGSDLHLFRIDEALRILREYEPPEGYPSAAGRTPAASSTLQT